MARTVRRASGVEAHYPDDVWRLMDDAERRAANKWYSQMISNPHRPIPPQPVSYTHLTLPTTPYV